MLWGITLSLYKGASHVAQYPTPLPKNSSSPLNSLPKLTPVANIIEVASYILSLTIKVK